MVDPPWFGLQKFCQVLQNRLMWTNWSCSRFFQCHPKWCWFKEVLCQRPAMQILCTENKQCCVDGTGTILFIWGSYRFLGTLRFVTACMGFLLKIPILAWIASWPDFRSAAPWCDYPKSLQIHVPDKSICYRDSSTMRLFHSCCDLNQQ